MSDEMRQSDVDETRPTQAIGPPSKRPTPIPKDDLLFDAVGTYRIQRVLAEGGMGIVFEAEDTSLCRPVALKVMKKGPSLDDAGEERFLREARAMAAIKSDHLVTVYQAGRDGDTVYLAMELLQGQTLEARISQQPALNVRDIIRIGREIALGLSIIHEHGLMHRDIKPTNIWLEEPHQRVKILDFGLVRGTNDTSRLTLDGLVVGTPAYLSPEQARGKEIDHRTDLFSLGCVLYRLCTGTLPFPAQDTVSQLVATASDEPTAIRELNQQIPKPLASLIHRLLAKNPNNRPRSAKVVANVLNRLNDPATAPIVTPVADDTQQLPPAKTKRTRSAKIAKAKRTAAMNARRQERQRWRMIVGGVVVFALFAVVAVGGASRWWAGGPLAEALAKNQPNDSSSVVYLKNVAVVEQVSWPFRPGPPKQGNPPPPPPDHEQRGKHKHDRGPMNEDFETVMVRGQRRAHGIFMHPAPPQSPTTKVSYKLDGQFRQFSSQVTINDTSRGPVSPIIFKVYGDGKLLWESTPVHGTEHEQTLQLDVTGVKILSLSTEAGGDIFMAHSVWVDPQLRR